MKAADRQFRKLAEKRFREMAEEQEDEETVDLLLRAAQWFADNGPNMEFDEDGRPYQVYAGDYEGDLVEAVYLDGEKLKDVTAFDRQAGWVNYVDLDREVAEFRKYGEVTVEWKA